MSFVFSGRSKERKVKCEEWYPRHFQQDFQSGKWVYKHSDLRPWDPRNDLYQYENEYIVQTKTKHPTPMIRTGSIISVEPPTVSYYVMWPTIYLLYMQLQCESRISTLKAGKRKKTTKQLSSDADANDSATTSEEFHSDSAHSVKMAATNSK